MPVHVFILACGTRPQGKPRQYALRISRISFLGPQHVSLVRCLVAPCGGCPHVPVSFTNPLVSLHAPAWSLISPPLRRPTPHPWHSWYEGGTACPSKGKPHKQAPGVLLPCPFACPCPPPLAAWSRRVRHAERRIALIPIEGRARPKACRLVQRRKDHLDLRASLHEEGPISCGTNRERKRRRRRLVDC